MLRHFPTLALTLILAGCVYPDPQGGAPMPLINGAGQQVGVVTAYQSGGGVTFKLEAAGLPHGVHGLHVHTTGRCDPPEFHSAGPHWNPLDKLHGISNPKGPHAGDLSNVTVAANGVLSATVTLGRCRPDHAVGRSRRAPRQRRRRAGAPRRGRRLYDRPERQERPSHRLRGPGPDRGPLLTRP